MTEKSEQANEEELKLISNLHSNDNYCKNAFSDDDYEKFGLKKVKAYVKTDDGTKTKNAERVKKCSEKRKLDKGIKQVNVLVRENAAHLVKAFAENLKSTDNYREAIEKILLEEIKAKNPEATLLITTETQALEFAKLNKQNEAKLNVAEQESTKTTQAKSTEAQHLKQSNDVRANFSGKESMTAIEAKAVVFQLQNKREQRTEKLAFLQRLLTQFLKLINSVRK